MYVTFRGRIQLKSRAGAVVSFSKHGILRSCVNLNEAFQAYIRWFKLSHFPVECIPLLDKSGEIMFAIKVPSTTKKKTLTAN